MFAYKFSAVIPPWKSLNGSYPFICDCRYKNEAAAANYGICSFEKLVKKVRESYRSQKKPALAFALDSLGLEDQKCRTLNRYVENMYAYMADLDSTDRRWNVSFFSDTSYLCPIRDEMHTQALIKMIGYEDSRNVMERSTNLRLMRPKDPFIFHWRMRLW